MTQQEQVLAWHQSREAVSLPDATVSSSCSVLNAFLCNALQTAEDLPSLQGALHRVKENEYHQLDVDGLMTELAAHQQVAAAVEAAMY